MVLLADELVERFFRYVAISSQSDARVKNLPSSEGQLKLAKLLAQELEALSLKDIHLDDYGNLTAYLPGNVAHAPKVGFLAHLDTVDVGLSADITPQKILFDGADVCLNPAQDIWLRVAEHPEILPYQGQEIIFSDGTSVLGADNKSAIAIVMTLLHRLVAEGTPHGDVYVAFVPDEEIGMRGSKKLDLARFPVNFAYTIDSCELGEVVYETFNAAAAEIVFTGVTAHPMSSKGVLVNPLRVMHDFMGYFDRYDTPEFTQGREGCFWFRDASGGAKQAKLTMAIRDFDKAAFEARKAFLMQAAELTQARHPTAKIECNVVDNYSNISSSLGDDRTAIDVIFAALQDVGVEPQVIAMRGGTDGSVLSARGVITPNYFTGAHNFHSQFEFLPIPSFIKSFEVTQRICERVAQGG